MSKSTQKKIEAFAAAAAIGVAVVAPTSAQAGSKPLSPEQTIEQIERFSNKWAPAFAAGSNKPWSQPVHDRIDCETRNGRTIKNCTPLSSAYRKSFEDARVEDIAIKYGQAGVNYGNAGVKFSNGEAVELHFQGAVPGGAEFSARIDMIGGKAGRKLFKCCSTN